MIRPNLFIVGAPKCGTTALYTYLQTHPNVFMPQFKEPHFFADDFPKRREGCANLNDYLKLYKKAKSIHTVVGDASVFYMYSKTALRNIYQYNPDAKIIIMLRNPVDMLYSFHFQRLYQFRTEVQDFETEWHLQEERRLKGDQFNNSEDFTYGSTYEFGLYLSPLRRIYDIFPKDQVMVILFDDFVKSTATVYRTVLEFLALPNDGKVDFPPVNEGKSYRNRSLAHLIKNPPFPINTVKRGLKKLLKIQNAKFVAKIYKRMDQSQKRSPLSAEFRRELIEVYRASVDELGQFLRRDLSAWHQ